LPVDFTTILLYTTCNMNECITLNINISIIIPVHFEEENIEKVFVAITKYIKNSYEILIIYDSSDDPTIS